MAVTRKEATDSVRERVIEMFCAPKKRSIKSIANENGIGVTTASRIIRTFQACRDGDEEMIVNCCRSAGTIKHLEFSMRYLGIELDGSLRGRVQDALDIKHAKSRRIVIDSIPRDYSVDTRDNLVEMVKKFTEIVGTLNMISGSLNVMIGAAAGAHEGNL